MVRRRWFLLTVLLLIFNSLHDRRMIHARDVEAPALEIVLEPRAGDAKPRFQIDLTFTGDATGKTSLVLPSKWAGESELYRCITNLQVVTEGVMLSDGPEPHIKLLTHAPNQKLRIRYELVQDKAEALAAGRNAGIRPGYRPILQPNYFHWIGYGAWVLPDWKEREPAAITMVWKNFPPNWSVSNSYGSNQARQEFRASMSGLRQAVFVGGDFDVKQAIIRGKPVHIAMRGKWGFKAEEFTTLVQKIIELEREFWDDFDHSYYLVTLLPLESKGTGTSTGGTGLINSFATFVTPNVTIERLKFLIAHEYFHNWNAKGIGRMKDPEQLRYWFSEGFTDYYTWLLLLRGGLVSLEDYVTQFNQMLREYYLSPVNTADNQRVRNEFFSDAEINRLPYWRGRLLATEWNTAIKLKSGGRLSLDDVMRDLLRTGRKQMGFEVSENSINECLKPYLDRDLLPQMAKYIDRGEMIVPDKEALGPCAQLEPTALGEFEPGFDLEILRAKNIIAGVKKESAAYEAGLRDGQVVVKRTLSGSGDPAKPIELTIKDGEQEKTISFFPASRTKKMIPQFKLKTELTSKQRARCLQWFGKS